MEKQEQLYWIETKWQLGAQHQEELLLQLEPFQILGSFENIPLDKTIAPQDTIELTIYFPNTNNTDTLKKQLERVTLPSVKLITLEKIPMGDWATAWKQYFHPLHLTSKIVICPSWESYQKQPHEIVVTLDPGMAFGTGQHDTTRFCAELIDKLKTNHPHISSLLDVGCGSGILSIIAAKCGYTNILGIDIDEHAIATSEENLSRNPEINTNHIQFLLNHEDLSNLPNQQYDVVVANIFAETICELKDTLIKLLKPNGFLLLSGIMFQSDTLIEENFKHLSLIEKKSSQDWHAYIYCQK